MSQPNEEFKVVAARERKFELDILQELRAEMRSTRESMARMEGEVKALHNALGQAQSNGQLIAVLNSEVANLKATQQSQKATTLGIIAVVVPTIISVIMIIISLTLHK